MTTRIAIQYGEFYDFPRQIEFQFRGEWYFLRSEFNEEKDDYNDYYDVYLFPFRSDEEIKANPCYWMNLSRKDYLGRIPIADLGLDETRRRSIDADAMAKWLSAQKNESRVR
jgi:hypothetical protein